MLTQVPVTAAQYAPPQPGQRSDDISPQSMATRDQ